MAAVMRAFAAAVLPRRRVSLLLRDIVLLDKPQF
jgi:hypothetical protein